MNELLGRNPDQLSLLERRALTGTWLALELYNPANLALRRIAAAGSTPESCRAFLEQNGKDPVDFQYVLFGSGG